MENHEEIVEKLVHMTDVLSFHSGVLTKAVYRQLMIRIIGEGYGSLYWFYHCGCKD
jgi:hypothetical protein